MKIFRRHNGRIVQWPLMWWTNKTERKKRKKKNLPHIYMHFPVHCSFHFVSGFVFWTVCVVFYRFNTYETFVRHATA